MIKKMRKYKAVIFDMDGTLLDTLEDIAGSVNYALDELGFPLLDISQVRDYVGNGVLRMMELSLPGGTINPRINDAISLFKQHYSKNNRNKTHPYTGITNLLQNLSLSNYKLAVISNKFDTAVKELNAFYFSKYIDVAIGESDNIRRKPAADMLSAAMSRLGVKAGESVYIGDSEVDIETALNAGVDCISVAWGFRDRNWLNSHGAKTIVDSPGELAALL
jgi:phosphoglycolate phosphatase